MSDDAAEPEESTIASGDDGALVEVVHAQGHENVTAEHVSTLEFTSDDFLTPAGDCILAVEADRVPADFDDAFLDACRAHGATITATIEAAGHAHEVIGRGHPDFSFENERSHVIRTSDYVDDRTVMVGATGAAADVDRDLVAVLADGADATLTLEVDPA
ncbi:DUF371 domain-containing protein [Halosimplex litoreum]|uniref:DUF371 domain-containing protein n=1 Tax=Halosimplex litoreum TaxID=1198301 RepID=A0A7T3KW79_9EURY|nr:DUF371 domain-containing protein [Halosimplex litoreum]QPV63763.1 DUF371 domain-containing protein [Halosimplex litoreum]